jgi:hypothetical protein
LEAGADPRQDFKTEELLRSSQRIIPDDVNERWWPDRNKSTAAFVACLIGNQEMLELMLQFGVSANEKYQDSALLSVAAYANCKEAVSNILTRLFIFGHICVRSISSGTQQLGCLQFSSKIQFYYCF